MARKLSWLALAFVLVILGLVPGPASAQACFCPTQDPWYSVRGTYTVYTDCATAAYYHEQNLRSYANGQCRYGACESYFATESCVTNPDGSVTHKAIVFYHCYVCQVKPPLPE